VGVIMIPDMRAIIVIDSPQRDRWAHDVFGHTAIRSLETAVQLGMRGQDDAVFDNLGGVEVKFLPSRCRSDAQTPRSRLTLNTVKRA
jgi:hypothetical protein